MSSIAEDFSRLGFYVTLELLRPFRFPWVVRCLRLLGRLQYCFSFGTRRRAHRWMEASLSELTSPEERRHKAREYVTNGVLREFLNYLIMIQDANRYSNLVEIDGWHRVCDALASGRGVVLLGTHVGMPRLLRWHLRTRDFQVYHLVKMALPKMTNSWRGRLRRWRRNRYHLDDSELFGQEALNVQYLKKAYDHLQRNGLVHIAGDGPSAGRRIPVKICGREMTIGAGGLSLGVMSGAVILPCFTAFDESPRFQIQFQPPLCCGKTEDRSKQLEMLANDYALRVEEYIRLHPTNVFKPRYLDLAESHGI